MAAVGAQVSVLGAQVMGHRPCLGPNSQLPPLPAQMDSSPSRLEVRAVGRERQWDWAMHGKLGVLHA